MREIEATSKDMFIEKAKIDATRLRSIAFNHANESLLYDIHSQVEPYGLEVVSWHEKSKRRIHYVIQPIRQIEANDAAEVKATVRGFSGPAPASLADRATGVVLGECQFDYIESTLGFQIKIPIQFPGNAGYVRMFDPNEECIQQFSLDTTKGKIRVEIGTMLLVKVPQVPVVNDAGEVIDVKLEKHSS